jgi:hypothetical protein
LEHPAHGPIFEEAAKLQRIMEVDALGGGNSLADERLGQTSVHTRSPQGKNR